MRKIMLMLTAMAFVAPAMASALAFEEVDANGDGLLSMEEVSAAMPEADAEIIVAADTNGDGALSAEEFATIAQ